MKKVTRALFLTAIAITVLSVSQSFAGTKTIGVPIYSDLTHLTQNIPLSTNDPFFTEILSFSQQLEQLLDKILGYDPGNNAPYGGNGGGTGTGNQNAPLDGGVILLMIAGLALGTKMVMDRNKALKKQNVAVAHIIE